MMKNYEETIEKLKKYNQNEIVNIMSKVYTEEENKKLIEQLNRIDLNQVMNLYKNANNIPLIDERKIDHVCSAMLQFAGLHAAMPEVADGGRRGGGDHRDR